MDCAAVYCVGMCCGAVAGCALCVGMCCEQWLGVRRMLSNKRMAMDCLEGYLLYSQVHRGG